MSVKDIIGAIAEEESYINERLQGIDSSLPQRLSEYGYNTLDDYFADKKDYLFAQWKPELYVTDIAEFPPVVEDALINKKYGVYMVNYDGVCAWCGHENQVDHDVCAELGVRVVELHHSGGVIISSENDVDIMAIAPMSYGLTPEDFMKKYYEILSSHFSDAEIVGNDILIGGKKVVGMATGSVNGVFMIVTHVSFVDYTELINKICTKKSEKEPGFVDSTVFTRDEMVKEVLLWLQKQ